MIFAELAYDGTYDDAHDALVALLSARFADVTHGQQGDSWIHVRDGEALVAVDTFTTMRHQVKSAAAGPLVAQVLAALATRYALSLREPPEPEGHE